MRTLDLICSILRRADCVIVKSGFTPNYLLRVDAESGVQGLFESVFACMVE